VLKSPKIHLRAFTMLKNFFSGTNIFWCFAAECMPITFKLHPPLHGSHSFRLCHVLVTTRAAVERFVKQAVTNKHDTVLENYKVIG
jgi:hypothetical protein